MIVRPRSRTINGRVYKDWVVDLGKVDGEKRRTKSFPTEQAAENYLLGQRQLKAAHGEAAFQFSPVDAKRWANLEARLTAVGATPEQAVDYFIANHRAVITRTTLGALLDKCVLELELRGVRSNSVSTFACACRSFVAGRENTDPSAVTKEEVRRWLFGNGWGPKTQRSYLQAVTQMFNIAADWQMVAVSPLRKDGRKSLFPLPKMVKKEPSIFTAHQLERLFSTAWNKTMLVKAEIDGKDRWVHGHAYRRLIGFLALATFNGVRPFELTRLAIAKVDTKRRLAVLDAEVTKTMDRRVLPLSQTCLQWLKLWKIEGERAGWWNWPDSKQEGKIAPPSWDRLMKGLRKDAGLIPWPHDVLRHCFASYFHALHEDKKKLQAEMGHSESEETLDKHYRAVVGPDGRIVGKSEARKFYAITPEALGCAL